MTPIMVVGQVARDLVLVVDQLPEAGGSVDVGQRRELLGGKGGNIAVGLAHLGASVALMVDVVTSDHQWRYLESVPQGALLTVDVDQAAAALHTASTVILQLQQPAAAILAALDAVDPSSLVFMDGVPQDEETRDRILARASVLRLDAHEAELLVGYDIPDESTARKAASWLLGRGPELVVMAVGTDGNLVAWGSDAVMLPLLDADRVVDTTGGGDAFVATLAFELDRGTDRVPAARAATAAAGLTVTHPGGRPTLDVVTVQRWAQRVGADA